ncbi:30S ribosomal protein S17 [Patescibacteria group bacterium]|nr:30S ribosomal protein S17 [Patescibacteria group bacterium]
MIKGKFKGIVVSDKMDKTIIVNVTRIKKHPLYKKRYKHNKRFKVHDAKGMAKEGDNVLFQECRPLSKDKRWRLIEIIK